MNQEQFKLVSELAQKAIALYKLVQLEEGKPSPGITTQAQPSSTGPGFFAKKPPVARTTNSSGDPLITESEARRLFAIAREADWAVDEYTAYLKEAYSITHSRQLPHKFYRQAEANIKLGKPVACSKLKSGKDQQQLDGYLDNGPSSLESEPF